MQQNLTKSDLIAISAKTSVNARPFGEIINGGGIFPNKAQLYTYLYKLGFIQKHFSVFGVAVVENPRPNADDCKCYKYGVRNIDGYELVSVRQLVELMNFYLPQLKEKTTNYINLRRGLETHLTIGDLVRLFTINDFTLYRNLFDGKSYKDIYNNHFPKWAEKHLGIPFVIFSLNLGKGIKSVYEYWERWQGFIKSIWEYLGEPRPFEKVAGVLSLYLQYLVLREVYGIDDKTIFGTLPISIGVDELTPAQKEKVNAEVENMSAGVFTKNSDRIFWLERYTPKIRRTKLSDFVSKVETYFQILDKNLIAKLREVVGGFWLYINLNGILEEPIKVERNPRRVEYNPYLGFELVILDHGKTYLTFGVAGVSKILTHQLVRHKTLIDAVQTSDRYTTPTQQLYYEWLDDPHHPPKNLKDFAKTILIPILESIVNRTDPPEIKTKKFKLKKSVRQKLQSSDIIERFLPFYLATTQPQKTIADKLADIDNNREYLEAKFRVKAGVLLQYLKDIYEFQIPKEDAREDLPQAKKTKIVATFSKDTLKNFINLRTKKSAQLEIRLLASQLHNITKTLDITL